MREEKRRAEEARREKMGCRVKEGGEMEKSDDGRIEKERSKVVGREEERRNKN